MKKILIAFAVTFTLGLTAQAQQKPAKVQSGMLDNKTQETVKQAALSDLAALEKAVTFTGTQKDDFRKLFEHKHRMYLQELSDERKQRVAHTIEMKIKASLSPENIQKIENTAGLMQTLTGENKNVKK